MRPDPKTVLVTGAGSGIGRALALEVGRRGMRVGLVGRRERALRETADAVSSPCEPLVIRADLTDAGDRRRVIDEVAKNWGALDVLINNAGIVEGGALEATSDEAIEAMLAINVGAPIRLTRDLLPLLKHSAAGRVVNVGSIFGDIAYPDFATYSATKFAMRGFSDALRREMRGTGVGVTYCAPRATRTDAASAFSQLIVRTKMTLDEPDAVARHIWAGVLAERDRIYPTGAERVFVLVEKLFPTLVTRAIARQNQSPPAAMQTKDVRP